MKPTFKFFAIAALGLHLSMPSALMAQEADDPASEEVQAVEENMEISGQEEYIRYCSVCHGLDGKGGGPLAKSLRTPPADLTMISKRHNGGFPLSKIADIIRNGGAVAGHGSRDMPAWGEAFRDHEEPVMVSALIFELALYLDSIQVK
jgi:mono/diheme cytochrome c family protein